MKEKNIKKIVRDSYGRIAKQNSSCCSLETSCSCHGNTNLGEISKNIGYTDNDIKEVPEGSNLGLGCGNPIALASIKKGETLLDLGSGAGFDCFLAANKIGPEGKVIGVDMTPEMLDKARENALKGGYKNVEFRLGEIDNLPVADKSVDLIISNCVINLVPDKKRVFSEAYRVLKAGGRFMISDIVLLKELHLPDEVIDVLDTQGSCITGALMKEKYMDIIENTGFIRIKIINEVKIPFDFDIESAIVSEIIQKINIGSTEIIKIKEDNKDAIVSISVYGVKP